MEIESTSPSTYSKETKSCDAAIIFHDGDKHIEKELFPILNENRITFCYIDRDGLPGQLRSENYNHLICTSRKVVFIVSHEFLKSRELKLVVDTALMSHDKKDVISLKTDSRVHVHGVGGVKHTCIIDMSQSTWKKEIVSQIKTVYPDFVCLLENGKASDLLLLRGLCLQNFRFNIFGLIINCKDMCFHVNIDEYMKHISKHTDLSTTEACTQYSWLSTKNTTLSLAFKSEPSSCEYLQKIDESISKLIVGVMDPLEGNGTDHTPTWDLGCTVSGEYKNEHHQYISKFHRKTQFLLKNKTLSRQEIPNFCAYEDYKERLNSFICIEENMASPAKAFASAGFFLYGEDTVKCYFCGFTIFRCKGHNDPFATHSEHRPNCFFIRSHTPKQSLVVTKNILINAITNVDRESLESRIESLRRMDLTDLNSKEDLPREDIESLLHELAGAGFYHVQNRLIECFSCRTAVLFNKMDIDIWDLHASLSPNCSYLRRKKGQEFIRAIQSGMKRGGGGQTVVTFLLKVFGSNHRDDWDDYIFFPRFVLPKTTE